jgi:ribokinase
LLAAQGSSKSFPHLHTVSSAYLYSLVTYVEKFPQIGETIIGKSFEQTFGGKGANQAVILSRLGSQCHFCGMVGKDSYGESYLQKFLKEGVDISGIIQTSEAPTGVACITVADGGANMIIINPGANYHLSSELISSLIPKFQTASVMICQNEIPSETTLAALQLGSQYGMLTIFNPAPISADKEALWKSVLEADIVCPNETELFELLEQAYPVETVEEIEIAARQLIEKGVKIVLVTMGSRGALVATRQGTEVIPAPAVENCIDTVGAGDCFVGKPLDLPSFPRSFLILFSLLLGTLAHHLSHGASLHESIAKAVQCASISVTRKGAQESYPSTEELISLGLINQQSFEKAAIRMSLGLE